MKIEQISLPGFSETQSGKKIEVWALNNKSGLTAVFCNYGPRMISLTFPSAKGDPMNLLLGYGSAAEYEADSMYHGQLAVGPMANRIASSAYPQPDDSHPILKKGDAVPLPSNDGRHSLHSADDNWANHIWRVTPGKKGPEASLTFDLEFNTDYRPGQYLQPKKARITVTLSENNQLTFAISAESDFTVPINPTFHGYFNLNGGGEVKNHWIQSTADRYLPVDDELIPTGEVLPVANGNLDFLKPVQLRNVFGERGFDHCLVFPKIRKQVEVWSPDSKISLKFATDQPAFQLYTGFFLGKPFNRFGGLCLEAQKLVDAVHHPEWKPDFGPVFTKSSEPYLQNTSYTFRLKDQL